MANKHGSLSIDSDNLFPIIKKWLYSDHDIFYRELISNGCDAITKLKKLDMMGETEIADDEELKVQVIVNPNEKINDGAIISFLNIKKLVTHNTPKTSNNKYIIIIPLSIFSLFYLLQF